jgi:hypothetical protein
MLAASRHLVSSGLLRSAPRIWSNQSVGLFPASLRRGYCEPAEGEGDDLPEGEEWVMLRQAKKSTKKRMEAKKKQAVAWKNIAWQSWTHMYRPEHAKEALRAIKHQSRYDDVVLTPKDGDRYIRVYRARIIQEQNQARELKVFPKPK